jgi:predicted permease
MGMLRRLGNLSRRVELNSEIDAEMQAHIEMRVEENIAAGMSPEEARRRALVRFGNRTLTGERTAAADSNLGFAGIGRDVRYSLRQLRRSPGFAFTAILTLALGIGANVVVFGVLNSVLLRPLNVVGAERLVQIEQREQGYNTQSYPDYADYRARNTAMSDMAAYRIGALGLSTGGAAQRCWMYEVSGNYFDMLGVEPELGRLLHQSDERGPNSAPYVMLSDSFWRSRFNADPHIIGSTVELNKHRFTVIGVTPKSFHGTELFFWPDVWLPIVNAEQIEGYSFLAKRFNHGTLVIGELKPGVTRARAVDDLDRVGAQLSREYPKTDDGIGVRLTKPGLMGDMLGRPTRAFLTGLMLLSLLVLAAAGANLAGIFAARAADRTRELAIRLSIGSTRWRILRQVLTEAFVVSIAGGIAGTLAAAGLIEALSRWQPIAEFPIRVDVAADARVFAIAFALSLAAGILPGLLPARQIWRTDATQALKSGSAAPGLLRRFSLRDALLGVQITLCALLVTASLVSLRGMERSLHAPFGFAPQDTVLVTTDMHMAGYTDDSAFPVQRRLIEEAARVPGVTETGTIDSPPLSGGGSTTPVYREGTPDPRDSNSVMVPHYFNISPGYLRAAGTRLLSGRDFTWADDAKAPQIALVNETFAHTLFGNSPAVGKRFMNSDKSLVQIVGVVEDGKYDSLTETPGPAMFFPLGQGHEGDTTLVVRSKLPPGEIAGAVRRVVAGIDSSLPLQIESWPDALALVLFPARVATAALSVMGLLAAMLAITGIFGMAAYSVSKRLRELGIRMALGAQRAQVMRSALGRPMILLLSGSAAGVLLGVLASRLLASLVYDATPRDPLVLAGAALAMMLIGLVASWIPARRALGVNPAQLLREE